MKMLAKELIYSGQTFGSYRFYWSLSGELAGTTTDRFEAIKKFGDYEVTEWSAHASQPGFATDFVEIILNDEQL